MTWSVVWTDRARRDLRRLDRVVAARVAAAVDRYASTGQGDMVFMQAVRPPERRLRVGDWRVRFRFDSAGRALIILRVLPRGRAYRD